MAILKPDNRARAAAVVRQKLANNRGRPPWQFAGRAVAFAARTARSQAQLRKATSVGVGVWILGRRPLIHNRGILTIGNSVRLESRTRRIYFHVWPEGELTLGDGAAVNDGARIECMCAIRIGERVGIAFDAVIIDSDFHAIHDRRMRPPGKPVVIEDDAWVAANAMIFPGVTVGEGAVVAGGAVVRHDVPPFTLVAGNPARVLRTLDVANRKRRVP